MTKFYKVYHAETGEILYYPETAMMECTQEEVDRLFSKTFHVEARNFKTNKTLWKTDVKQYYYKESSTVQAEEE